MQVEIVEFYPYEHNPDTLKTSGTLHIYLPEIGMDIRGCLVFVEPKKFYVTMPQLSQIDHTTGIKEKFPAVSFCSESKLRAFMESLKKEAFAYVKPICRNLPRITPKYKKKKSPGTQKKAQGSRHFERSSSLPKKHNPMT